MKHPTEGQILFHLVGVAQTALDAGDSHLARHLVAQAYAGFDILRRERVSSVTGARYDLDDSTQLRRASRREVILAQH